MNFAPVVKFGSKMLLKLRKSAPAIMTGAGIILGGACVVTACVQTTKLPETIRENKERIEELHNAPESSQEPRRASELRKEYISMAGKTARLYAVPATLGALSVACTIGGHKVLTKENAALASAYIALDKSFRAYKEKMPLPTTRQETVEEEIDNQKVDGSKDGKVSDVDKCELFSPYARLFDHTNYLWTPSGSGTASILHSIQNYCNDKLHRDGYLFLNDVYDQLGFERTEAGQQVGWFEGNGDSCVDFGLFHKGNPTLERLMQGKLEYVVLDFNVDGPIMHMLPRI